MNEERVRANELDCEIEVDFDSSCPNNNSTSSRRGPSFAVEYDSSCHDFKLRFHMMVLLLKFAKVCYHDGSVYVQDSVRAISNASLQDVLHDN